MGVFASIYHPVGIPMLVQNAKNPGFTIGVNGLAGNLGIAVAAILTGFLVKHAGWRAAFAVPGGDRARSAASLFLLLVPREEMAPGQAAEEGGRPAARRDGARLLVMTLAAISGSLIFNFTTNGNGQLLGRAPARRGGRPRHARHPARGGLHGGLARPARGRQAHRPLPAQADLAAGRGGADPALPARRAGDRLAALRAGAGRS